MDTVDCTSAEQIYHDYAYPILFSLAGLSLIPPTVCYIHAYIRNKLKVSPVIFWLGIAFYAVIFIAYLSAAIYDSFLCHNDRMVAIFLVSNIYLYFLQCALLILVLFTRLILIFKKGVHKVSRRFIVCFSGMVIADSVLTITGISLLLFSKSLHVFFTGLFMYGLGGVIYLSGIIVLNGLFIYKLHRIYLHGDRQSIDDKLVNVVTKILILSIVSCSTVVLHMIAYFSKEHLRVESPHFYLVSQITFVCDLHTNFWSIFLTYHHFHAWYHRLCGCCHSRCISWWKNCVVDRDLAMMMKQETSTHASSRKRNETELTCSGFDEHNKKNRSNPASDDSKTETETKVTTVSESPIEIIVNQSNSAAR